MSDVLWVVAVFSLVLASVLPDVEVAFAFSLVPISILPDVEVAFAFSLVPISILPDVEVAFAFSLVLASVLPDVEVAFAFSLVLASVLPDVEAIWPLIAPLGYLSVWTFAYAPPSVIRVIKSEISLPLSGPCKSSFVIFPANPICGGRSSPFADFPFDRVATISPFTPDVPL